MELEGRKFTIPLAHPIRGVQERTGTLYEGPHGWGEYSPFPGFPGSKERCLESALFGAYSEWPKALRDTVPVYITIPDVSAESARVIASGWQAAKVKVGTTEGADIRRVEAVRDVIGPTGWLMIDANAAWEADEAVSRIERMRRFDVALVEQPCATLEDLARVRRLVDVPIAVDESFNSAADAAAIRDARSADVVVVKVQYLGGAGKALQAIEESGLPAIVSSPIETSVGVAYSAAFAASLPNLPFPCGLATLPLLIGDVVDDPLTPKNGEIEVRKVKPSEELLMRYATKKR